MGSEEMRRKEPGIDDDDDGASPRCRANKYERTR